MNLSQNSLFKADTSVRPVAESGILGLVQYTGASRLLKKGLLSGKKNRFYI
jgi:hypothetical protein